MPGADVREVYCRRMAPGLELDTAIVRIVSLSAHDEPKAALAEAARAEAALVGADRGAAARLAAFRALPHFIAADFDEAALATEAALLGSRGADPETRALALAARLLAGAGALWAAADRGADERLAGELWQLRGHVLGGALDTPAGLPGVSLLIEALFATGRVSLASQALDEAFPGHDWSSDPLPRETRHGEPLPSLPFLPLRILFYTGRTAEAEELLERVLAQARAGGDETWLALSPSLSALLASCTDLVRC